jgi:arginine decarboxylase
MTAQYPALGQSLNSPLTNGAFDLNSQRQQLWLAVIDALAQMNATLSMSLLQELILVERYWAFPSLAIQYRLQYYVGAGQFNLALQLANNCMAQLKKPRGKAYTPFITFLDELDKPLYEDTQSKQKKPCFDLLIIHPNPLGYFDLYDHSLKALQQERDECYYDLLFVNNIADAALALMSNPNIQAYMSVSGSLMYSDSPLANLCLSTLQTLCRPEDNYAFISADNALIFTQVAAILRPEIEHYYLSELPFAELSAHYFQAFHRVFYHEYPFKDLHHFVLNGLRERYHTPFYHALHAYSKKPKGVFHALPISRASSIKDSLWVKDFYQFYGENTFNGETSSTQGGMDSLLNPKGAIKSAHDKAATCFGAQHSFFVTNGTSTSNKIVTQANLIPEDIVFVSSDCHKSIPYAIMLCGAHAVFLETNAVDDYDLYGAVPLALIINKMEQLAAVGLLHRLRHIILTNSTFDGLIYDVEAYMMAILAMKPDIVFHWDEAWFAHAHFNVLYHRRHAMNVAKRLNIRFQSAAYRQLYDTAVDRRALPDPNKVVLRVYATQSTHKSLSSFRQGSMIHVYDQAFNHDHFFEAFYIHTSTSPNYQILASLDIARRQMALEGYQRTLTSVHLAVMIRQRIAHHPTINHVFTVLNKEHIYPDNEGHQPSEHQSFLGFISEFNGAGFVIDPTRITVDISKTGMDGNQFRKLLIDKYDIQVNKTSRNTVLFIVNIGATEQTAHYLIQVLAEIAERLLSRQAVNTAMLTSPNKEAIHLPQHRRYHSLFSPVLADIKDRIDIDIIDMRQAFYVAFHPENISYLLINHESLTAAQQGHTWVSASYVTPYPPGFPVLVPGQMIDAPLLCYLATLKIKEIHGYHESLGLKIISTTYLQQHTNTDERKLSS